MLFGLGIIQVRLLSLSGIFEMVYIRFKNLFQVISRHCSSRPPIKFTMAKKFILYGDEASPPVRFVMMTASKLDINLDFHFIDVFKAENKSTEYAKINPLLKVPALQIDEEIICDSHAISLYLSQKSENNSLYPEDPMIRARINQIMFFNCGTLFPIDSFIFTEYFRGKWPADVTKIAQWYSALDHLEYQLTNRTWLASNKLSLADLCCGATVSSMQLLVPPLDRHVKIHKWMQELQKLPCYEINSRGLERLKSFILAFN